MPEPDIPQKKPRKRGRMLIFAVLGVLLLCSVLPGWNYYRVAAVQDALKRDWEITFDTEGRPSAMPKILDDALQKMLGDRENRWGKHIPYIVYRERVRAMFRGSITEIHIYYPEGFRGDLGAALLRFGELKKLTVIENEPLAPTEADYKLLCQRIREMPHLEELELAGTQLTSDALAPLVGHPKLKHLIVSHSGSLIVDVLETLKKLPVLKTLDVGVMYGPDEDRWNSPAELARFRKELPGVAVTLPEP